MTLKFMVNKNGILVKEMVGVLMVKWFLHTLHGNWAFFTKMQFSSPILLILYIRKSKLYNNVEPFTYNEEHRKV